MRSLPSLFGIQTGTSMKQLILTGVLSAVIPLVAVAALKTGATAPEFTAQASLAGQAFTFSLKEHLKKGPVVVYFYPSAYTGGCNMQAHNFAVNTDKFLAAGASLVGVSQDSIERLNEFSADPDYCAGKFPVASDADGAISKAYDLSVREAKPGMKDSRGEEIDHGFTERTTFVITSDGKIAATVGGVSPVDNVNQALEAVQKLSAKSTP